MKKLFQYLYKCIFRNKKHCTEIRLVFNNQNSDPNLILNLGDLENRTAVELAKVFYILQNGSVQKFLVEKIVDVSEQYNSLFLQNVYDEYNKLSPQISHPNKEYPVIRPLSVFNTNKNETT